MVEESVGYLHKKLYGFVMYQIFPKPFSQKDNATTDNRFTAGKYLLYIIC